MPPIHLPSDGLYLIDGIGPFFRAAKASRINWSKIPFTDLPEDEGFWETLREEFTIFADKARELGFNAITLDDLAHLTEHPAHDDETNRRIRFFAEQFEPLLEILTNRGLQPWITSDILCLSKSSAEKIGDSHAARNAHYLDLVDRFLKTFPTVKGLILRIGESDGLDVKDPIRSHLHLRTPKQTNQFLRALLPLTDQSRTKVILRTWTVGAHRIGDLIWHRGRLADTLKGITSPHFILSMKPGESDFFRHIPLNRAFFQYQGPKLLELQARREYEGAGEFPSYIGFQNQWLRDELTDCQNLLGISVWGQTGGWHRFKRLTFLDPEGFWNELNVRSAIDIFRHQLTPEQSLARVVAPRQAAAAVELMQHSDYVVSQLYYIAEFARMKLFFRRVRIPPLLHIYWDSLFIHAPIRKLLRHFVSDHDAAISQAEGAMQRFPRMIELCRLLDWPVDDIHFMRDTCQMITLARRYYFSRYDPALVETIRKEKDRYKKNWPASKRARYRIKTNFKPAKIKRRTLAWGSRLLLRKKRGYRPLLDHLFTLNLLSILYRLFKNRSQKSMPKFIRKSAMGIDSLFR
ncbi:hypothetical protein NT6N_12740 [Oceaniferula spumae]|uniref:Glycosyl hydrolase family 67 n=1 Tax=Oceaniferula spumae TaxID=2979115 RepID=A0AAT9FJQ9_9BACT